MTKRLPLQLLTPKPMLYLKSLKLNRQKTTVSPNAGEKSGLKSKIWSKIEILLKSRKCGQKSKLLTKIENLVKYSKIGKKLKFW